MRSHARACVVLLKNCVESIYDNISIYVAFTALSSPPFIAQIYHCDILTNRPVQFLYMLYVGGYETR